MVNFVDACVLDIVNNMMWTNFSATSFWPTYDRYIRVAKKLTRNNSILSLLLNLAMDTTVVKKLGITPPNEEGLQISTERDIILIIKATDEFVRNDHKPAPFHISTS